MGGRGAARKQETVLGGDSASLNICIGSAAEYQPYPAAPNFPVTVHRRDPLTRLIAQALHEICFA